MSAYGLCLTEIFALPSPFSTENKFLAVPPKSLAMTSRKIVPVTAS